MRTMMIMLLPALDFEAVVVQLDLRECFLRSVLQALKSELLAFGCHSAQSLSQSAIQKTSFFHLQRAAICAIVRAQSTSTTNERNRAHVITPTFPVTQLTISLRAKQSSRALYACGALRSIENCFKRH